MVVVVGASMGAPRVCLLSDVPGVVGSSRGAAVIGVCGGVLG